MDFTKRPPPTQNELLDRKPPCDHPAERALLSSLFLLAYAKNCGHDVPSIGEVLRIVPVDAFDDRENRSLYEAIKALHRAGKPVDVTLVCGQLLDVGSFEGTESAALYLLHSLWEDQPTWRCWQFYADRVNDVYRRRKARARGEQLIRSAHLADGNGPTPARKGKVRA